MMVTSYTSASYGGTIDITTSDGTTASTSAGYGGSIDLTGSDGTTAPLPNTGVHFNQGIGNGAEGGDPGKSQPHGSSNDELGQVPGSYRGGVLGASAASTDSLTGTTEKGKLVGTQGCHQFTFKSGKAFSKNEMGVTAITDFIAGTDKIVLSKSTFKCLNSAVGRGFNKAIDFAVVATDADVARSGAAIVFSAQSKSLFYNENRSANGLGTGAKFATLCHISQGSLSTSDFVVQA